MKQNEIVKTTQPTPMVLLQQAMENKVDMAQLEKLMELQERWEKKEARKKYFEALAKFQNTVPVLRRKKTANIPGKDGKPGFAYRYADLAEISQGIKKPLSDCGLSYRWEFAEANGSMKATCLLSHKDGHTETTTMEAGYDTSGSKNSIQSRGSTQTYLQRYTLIGALGLSTADQDNDGKASPAPPPATKKQPEQKPQQSNEEYLEQWRAEINGCKTQIALTALYKQNQRNVDGDPKIQGLFKVRQNALKDSSPAKVEIP